MFYALEFIACSGVFYLLYRLLLEGRVSHKLARVTLVAVVLFSAVIPLLELPILPARSVSDDLVTVPLEATQSVEVDTLQGAVLTSSVNWNIICLSVYLAVAVLLMVRFTVGVIAILRLQKMSQITHCKGYSIAVNGQITEPFSFGRTIFVAKSTICEQIRLHEQSHIVHHHTAERLFFETMRSIFWFNPFVHLAAKSISQVQEWQADSDVIESGYDIDEYRKIIFHQLFGYSPDITCGLNSNLTKKRFIMMTKFKTTRHQWLRLSATLPVVVMMIFAFGAVCAEELQEESKQQPKTSKIEIKDGGKTILLNSKPVTLEQLSDAVKSEQSEVVSIDCDKDVNMGSVADVKQVLRANGNLRLVYEQSDKEDASAATEANQSQIKAIMAAPGAVASKSELKERNLLVVEVADDGSILLRGEKCSPNRLKKEVKRFVQNYHIYALNTRKLHVGNYRRKDYSEFTTIALTMPDGERMACPVSKGVVCIKSVERADAAKVNQIRDIIAQAYAELKDRLSGRIYGKSYNKLDQNGKNNINKAVPVQVCEIVGTV